MKSIVKNFVTIATIAASLAVVSCHKDDTLRYNNVTMGNVVAGSFISDQGNTFNVVEQTCLGRLDTMKRVILACDVLRETEGEAGTYDVRLNKVTRVLDKKPIVLSEITNDDQKVTNPIHIEHLWHSGGYMNMQIIIPIPEKSSTSHLINLVLDDNASNGNKYVFELRHNGFDEIWTEDAVGYGPGSGYVSFPIGKIISGDTADITIRWKSHKIVGNLWTQEIVDKKLEYKWKRDGFEQAPLEMKSKAATEIM